MGLGFSFCDQEKPPVMSNVISDFFSYSQWVRFAELRGCLFIDNTFHESQQGRCYLRAPQSLESFWGKTEEECGDVTFALALRPKRFTEMYYWDFCVKQCTPFCLGTGNILIFFSSVHKNKQTNKKDGGSKVDTFFFALVLRTFCLPSLSAKLYQFKYQNGRIS